MSDLSVYVERRAEQDPEFAENLELGYEGFKIGVLLRQARERDWRRALLDPFTVGGRAPRAAELGSRWARRLRKP